MQNDTITALASAVGRSAIAIVRLTGKDTFKVFNKVIGIEDIERLQHRTVSRIDIYRFSPAEGVKQYIDTCMVLPFVAPNSYTGEDLLEIYCHGGFVVPQLIVAALLDAGARMALPGEFTQRAFLNNKLDLVQAEAVEAIVSANSRFELAFAHQHYSGQFSREIKELRSQLVDLLSLLELELDFSEEDVEFADRGEILDRLAALERLLSNLLKSYKRSHLARQGVTVAIVGKPNVGKSSLLNLLLKKERAIVTEIPGTTRDIIEESIEINGKKFVFIDTAGIHTSDDLVEQEGIRRSRAALEKASAVLLLVDRSANLQKEDWQIRQLVLDRTQDLDSAPVLLANKSDLVEIINTKELEAFSRGFNKILFSCKTGENLEVLETELLDIFKTCSGNVDTDAPILINVRQKGIVSQALESVKIAMTHFDQNLSQEFISAELRQALHYLGELIGEVTTEDILGNIFSKFCIGK